MMHREVITKRKIPVITLIVLLVTVALYINEYVSMVNALNINLKKGMFLLLILISVGGIIKLISACNISYKYSIIGDKLIINKITSTLDKNVESVRIRDIVYVGKKKNMPKEFKGLKNKSYICNRIHQNEVICVYGLEDKYSKFTFQPSSNLIEKMNKFKK